jgi:hypothetical protein
VQSLQLSIDINRQSKEVGGDSGSCSGDISMSAYIRASHRMRSMSLVSGYLMSQKGSLVAKIGQRNKETESKWVTVFE